MDFCNNFVNYRGPPSSAPYHHHPIYPGAGALRYGHHHQMGQSVYQRNSPYYGYYEGGYHSGPYQSYPNYHYSSYANLREGFGGNYNAQYPSSTPSSPNYAYYGYDYQRPYHAGYREHPFYDYPVMDKPQLAATKGVGAVVGGYTVSHEYPQSPATPFHEAPVSRVTESMTPLANNQAANEGFNGNNNHSESTSTTPNSTDLCGSPRSDVSNSCLGRRSHFPQKEAKLSRKSLSSTNFTPQQQHLQPDPYDYPNYSPNDARVPNNNSPGGTHSWSPGRRTKKGLPMSDLELIQSSMDQHMFGPTPRKAHKMRREKGYDEVQVKRRKRQQQSFETEAEVKPQPSLTPLPGFQEAFGSTEIGRFSDVFFQLPESPLDYHHESDIDTLSPHPWEAGDSLEGPHFNLRVGASLQTVKDGSEGSPYDNYFSELSCNEF